MIADQVKRACQAHAWIELAVLFGSQASGLAGADSDVDVGVLADKPLNAAQKMALVTDIAAETGRPVDVVDIRTAGEPLLGQILTRGKRLFGTDETHARWLARHLLDAADFTPYVRRMLAERRTAWIGT